MVAKIIETFSSNLAVAGSSFILRIGRVAGNTIRLESNRV